MDGSKGPQTDDQPQALSEKGVLRRGAPGLAVKPIGPWSGQWPV